MSVDWRVDYGPSLGNSLDKSRLQDVYVKRAFNRFANESKLWLDDPDGNLDETFEYGTKVELSVKTTADSSYSRNFAGYVAGQPEGDRDTTTVDILSFDGFLRERTVNRGYDSQTVSYILEDLVTSLTPVDWAGGANVNLNKDPTISHVFEGAKLDDALTFCSNVADTRNWGANLDNEFFMQPTGNASAPSNLTDGRYFTAQERSNGKQAIFELILYYGKAEDNNRDAVKVSQQQAQDDLRDKLDTDDPVVIEISKYYPQISSKEQAKRKARDLLRRRGIIDLYDVETWEKFGYSPGDILRFEYPDRNVNSEFRVAQIEHRWQEDTTNIRLAENEEGVLDTLVKVSDEIARLDARGQDSAAAADEVADFTDPLDLAWTLKVTKRNFDAAEPYTPPNGQQVDFTMTDYTPPGGVEVDFELQSADVQGDSEVIVDKSSGG